MPQAQKVVEMAKAKPKAEPAPKAPQQMDDAELPPRSPLVRQPPRFKQKSMCYTMEELIYCLHAHQICKCLSHRKVPGCGYKDVAFEQAVLLTRNYQGADAARGPQAGEALRVHRSNPLGRRARGPAWPLEVGDDELLPAHCDAGMVLEVLEFLEVRAKG